MLIDPTQRPRAARPTLFTLCLSLLLSLLVAGCGGGGGDAGSSSGSSSGAGAEEPIPGSGTYSWILTSVGSTSALRYGVSLVHPAAPRTEFVIEPAGPLLTDVKLVNAGTVDGAGQRVTSVRPATLLYILAGDVRSLPLDANGSAPKGRVQRALSINACRFLVDANDHAVPTSSRFVVSTTGNDGRCDTADDGRAELGFNPSGAPKLTPLTGGEPLGVARDPATLAPRGWIYPKNVVFWASASSAIATTTATRSDFNAGFNAVVSATPKAVVVDDGSRLHVLEFASGSTTVSVRSLDASLSGGGGWQPIGFDADNWYVFQNAGNSVVSNWTVLKIARSAGTVQALARGSGFLSVASMGNRRLYVTVLGAGNNRLLAIDKASGSTVQTVESTATSTLTTVQTSVNDVHLLFRVNNIGTNALTYAVEMIDETGAKLFSTSVGGFPMLPVEATTQSFNVSESRSKFVFANGYGTRAYGDASLVAYDTGNRSSTVLGTLPGTSDFAQNIVYASVTSAPAAALGGFAARSLDGVIDEAGARSFSVDINTANSLKLTTLKR